MKKLITALLTASLAFTALTSGAYAERRRADINTELNKTDEIHILYNDKMVHYEDVKPIINEDRVMIPFRAALESMGAKVGYNDAERLVTAQKGNITIRFTLLDNTIYINKGGEESTIEIDVPMIIVEDRTLVPIRFMSNALGMQVGWEGLTRTVVIMDYDAVAEEISGIAPNISKYTAFENKQLNRRDFSVSYTSDSAGKLELSATAYKSGDMVYIKSDTISYLGDAYDPIAAAQSGAEWCGVDMKRIFRAFSFDDRQSAVLMSAMSAGSITDTVLSSMTREGEAVFSEAADLALLLDLYEQIDKYVSVTETEGGYSVSVQITREDFADILTAVFGVKPDGETRSALAAAIDTSVNANIAYDGEKQTSEVSFTMQGKAITYTETAAADTFTPPESSYDITNAFLSALSE